MRSAEVRALLSAGALASCALLAGCGSLLGGDKPADAAAKSAVPAAPAAAAKAEPARTEVAEVKPAAAPVPEVPKEPPLPPIDAATQRAFDDAVRALRAGRTDEAQRQLEALAKAQPQLAGVHANLALVHRRAGREAEAVAALEQAVKLSPKQPQYLNQLGISYRNTGRFAKAKEAYERAIALDAGYAAPQLNLAILLDLYLGERERAAEWYQRSAVLLPGDAAQINRWLAELKSRKPEASVASAAAVAQRKEKE